MVELIIGFSILSVLSIVLIRHASRPQKVAVKSRATGNAAKASSPQQITAVTAATPLAATPDPLVDFSLITDNTLCGDQRRATELLIANTARPSPVAGRIVSCLSDPDAELREITSLVSSEPLITAKLLGTVNSPAFGLAREVTSVQHAINYLGANLTKDLVLRIALEMDSPDGDVADPLAVRLVWSSSFIASGLAYQLARLNNVPQQAAVATMALLSSLGTLQLVGRDRRVAACYNEGSGLLERTRLEQSALNTNSAVVGARLAALWKLPPSIQEAVRFSLHLMTFHPDQCPGPFDVRNQSLVYFCCRVADYIVANGIEDIAEIPTELFDQAEFHYLPAYLAPIGLNSLYTQIRDPQVVREIHKIYQARFT